MDDHNRRRWEELILKLKDRVELVIKDVESWRSDASDADLKLLEELKEHLKFFNKLRLRRSESAPTTSEDVRAFRHARYPPAVSEADEPDGQVSSQLAKAFDEVKQSVHQGTSDNATGGDTKGSHADVREDGQLNLRDLQTTESTTNP